MPKLPPLLNWYTIKLDCLKLAFDYKLVTEKGVRKNLESILKLAEELFNWVIKTTRGVSQ